MQTNVDMPMHYPAIFMAVKIDTFQMKLCDISFISDLLKS